MITYHEVYGGLWVALSLLGVQRFPRQYGVARMQAALSRYADIREKDSWMASILPGFEPGLAGAEDAYKSAVAWGYTAGFCWENEKTDEVVIEIEEDLYRRSLSHDGVSGPDFHRAMLEFAKAFAKDLRTMWD